MQADIDSYQIFHEGDTLFSAMRDAIQNAKQMILMESYIFAEEIGWEFARILAKKVQQGVTVKLVIDAAGVFFYNMKALLEFLKTQGVETHIFHRWTWLNPMRFNVRNHRKLLIIDDHLVFLGGFNCHNAPSLRLMGNKRWRDTHICITGKLIEDAKNCFYEAWHGYAALHQSYTSDLIVNLAPGKSQLIPRHLRKIYSELWPKALKYIYLTTPYFVPDRKTQCALMQAAKNGVEVKIIVPAKSNHHVTRWAARAAYANLLRSGVRLFEYTPRMLHAKTFVMDDTWASIGSANMDYRSFFLNYEINLFTRHQAICHIIKEQFANDLKSSTEVHAGKWPARHWSEKVTELIGWFCRRWV